MHRRIEQMLCQELNLEDGEMMLPLKRVEIESLHRAIRLLIEDAACEGVR
jgi:hypothetical protein